MKVKVTLFFIFIFLIFNAIYGQEDSVSNSLPVSADTAKTLRFPVWTAQHAADTTVRDTTKIPYLSAEGIRFTDSLIETLKNNLSNLLGQDTVARISNIPFFVSQPQPFKELPRKTGTFDWFFVILFLFLTMLAVIRIIIPHFFVIFLSKRRKRDLYSTTENTLKNLVFFLLLLASWTGFSLALAEVLSFLKFVFPFHPLLFSFAVSLIYFFLQFLLRRIAGWIFRINSLVSEHLSRAVNVDFFWVLFVFLLIIINHYVKNDYLIWVVCFIFCINFLHKFFFACIIFSKKLDFLEILLYLCTIEVLPLLLFVKYIMTCFYKT